MKKITLLIAALFFASYSFSQVGKINEKRNKLGATVVKNIDLKTLKHHSKSEPSKRWYNYGDAIDAILGGNISEIYANILFPDSTILVQYTDGLGAPWIHLIGDVLDAHDVNFNDYTMFPGEMSIANTNSFNIDSIAVYGVYERHLADSIVDTLVIEVAVNNALQKYRFTGSQINTNLNADTVFMQDISYDQAKNSLGLAGKKTYKFLLTKEFYADSLENGLHYIEISTSDLDAVSAGKYVVSSVKFVPGYAWNPNVDTLDKKNVFRFLSYQESPGQFPMYTKGDFNISYIVPQDVRYNLADDWNGTYIPSFAYMGGTDPDDYSYQHHMIYYLASCTTCGFLSVNEIDQSNSFQLGNAYPNPVNTGSEIVIPFVLKEKDNVSVSVYNSVGQNIKNYVYDNSAEGAHKTIVNTADLNAGLYFYTIQTSKGRATKSFSVVNK